MTNVSDLVLAVKEKKEFKLFDEAKFICHISGKRISKDGINTYIYISEIDNLKLYLNEGNLMNGDFFQNVLVEDLNNSVYFDYFNNHSEKKGRTDSYVPDKGWEKLIETHCIRILCNSSVDD